MIQIGVHDPIKVRFDSDRHLTLREREILQLVGSGLTSRQISRRLWLSPSTVTTHMDRVRGKLRVHTTREAVQIALDAGLIPVEVVKR